MRNDLNPKAIPKRRKLAPLPPADHRAAPARLLDRQADAELQHGHIAAAEILAWRAAALREMAQ